MTACCGLDATVFGHTACPLAARPPAESPKRTRPEPDAADQSDSAVLCRSWQRAQVLRRIRTSVTAGGTP